MKPKKKTLQWSLAYVSCRIFLSPIIFIFPQKALYEKEQKKQAKPKAPKAAAANDLETLQAAIAAVRSTLHPVIAIGGFRSEDM